MSIHFLIKQTQHTFLFLLLTLLCCGLAYPGMITLILQLCFPYQANGSIIFTKSHPIGSELLGQQFTGPQYFWSRPSASSGVPYNPLDSRATNLGANNPLLISLVKERAKSLVMSNQEKGTLVPVDLVTSSASALDPHISIAAAYFQLNRIATIRKIDPLALKNKIDSLIIPRPWGFLGEPCINVLLLNIALDREMTRDESSTETFSAVRNKL